MNKNDIFNNYSLNKGTVEVANWGGEVAIQELSAGAMDAMRKIEGSELEMAVTVVLHGVVDSEGKRMFADADMEKLMEMSAADLVIVSSAIIELSDLGDSGK